jgi:predicted nuclease with TOPRIM domain
VSALEGERLVRVEEQLKGVREDLKELTAEQRRTRDRIHKIEGLQAMLVDVNKQRQGETEKRQHRLEWRLQVLTVVIAVAAIVVPVALVFLTGK